MLRRPALPTTEHSTSVYSPVVPISTSIHVPYTHKHTRPCRAELQQSLQIPHSFSDTSHSLSTQSLTYRDGHSFRCAFSTPRCFLRHLQFFPSSCFWFPDFKHHTSVPANVLHLSWVACPSLSSTTKVHEFLWILPLLSHHTAPPESFVMWLLALYFHRSTMVFQCTNPGVDSQAAFSCGEPLYTLLVSLLVPCSFLPMSPLFPFKTMLTRVPPTSNLFPCFLLSFPVSETRILPKI